MTPAAVDRVERGRRRSAGDRAIRVLHLLASGVIVVFLVVLRPVLPDFGLSIATPLSWLIAVLGPVKRRCVALRRVLLNSA